MSHGVQIGAGELQIFLVERLYATTSPLNNLDGTRTCSATHVINLRVTLHCNFHNVTEHKQQMSRVVNSKPAVRLLGNLSQRTNATLRMEAPALWKKKKLLPVTGFVFHIRRSIFLSLSLTLCSLALALYQVLDRNCLKRSGAKKNVEHGTDVPSRAVFVIYNYDKKKILKSDHSLVVEIQGMNMLTNKKLQEWAGWTPTSDEEQLPSKWKMIREDQLEVGRDVGGEGLVERSTATKGSCSSE